MRLRIILYFIASGLVALDQATKRMAYDFLSLSGKRVLIEGTLDLTYTENAGIALGLFGDHGSGVRWILIAISVTAAVMVAYSLMGAIERARKDLGAKFLACSMTFLLAGILGNLIDRVTLGYVVDFIDLYHGSTHWPIFNFADAAITLGAIGLAADVLWFSAGRKSHKTPGEPVVETSLHTDE